MSVFVEVSIVTDFRSVLVELFILTDFKNVLVELCILIDFRSVLVEFCILTAFLRASFFYRCFVSGVLILFLRGVLLNINHGPLHNNYITCQCSCDMHVNVQRVVTV